MKFFLHLMLGILQIPLTWGISTKDSLCLDNNLADSFLKSQSICLTSDSKTVMPLNQCPKNDKVLVISAWFANGPHDVCFISNETDCIETFDPAVRNQTFKVIIPSRSTMVVCDPQQPTFVQVLYRCVHNGAGLEDGSYSTQTNFKNLAVVTPEAQPTIQTCVLSSVDTRPNVSVTLGFCHSSRSTVVGVPVFLPRGYNDYHHLSTINHMDHIARTKTAKQASKGLLVTQMFTADWRPNMSANGDWRLYDVSQHPVSIHYFAIDKAAMSLYYHSDYSVQMTCGSQELSKFSAPSSAQAVPSTTKRPKGWEARGRSCYFESNSEALSDSAELACELCGASLVSVNDRAEQDFIWSWLQLLNSDVSYFVGLEKLSDKRYGWIDGSLFNISLDSFVTSRSASRRFVLNRGGYSQVAPDEPNRFVCERSIYDNGFQLSENCDAVLNLSNPVLATPEPKDETLKYSETETICPAGWITKMSSAKCYWFSNEDEDFPTASERCLSLSSRLIHPNTVDELTWIVSQLPSRLEGHHRGAWWSSLNYMPSQASRPHSAWLWSNCSAPAPNVLKWHLRDEHLQCAGVLASGRFSTIDCSTELRYICERSVDLKIDPVECAGPDQTSETASKWCRRMRPMPKSESSGGFCHEHSAGCAGIVVSLIVIVTGTVVASVLVVRKRLLGKRPSNISYVNLNAVA